MSLLSSILGINSGSDPRHTHRIYRVPITITLEIPVAAPSKDLAAAPEVLAAALLHMVNDVKSTLGTTGNSIAKIGEPIVVIRIQDLSPEYHAALPYEHPEHPTSKDLVCRDWFEL